MQVNVFISQAPPNAPPMLLVLPYGLEATIPTELQSRDWRHMAVTTIDSKLLGTRTDDIKAEIKSRGYAIVYPDE